MMTRYIPFFVLILLLSACEMKKKDALSTLKEEIIAIEKEFAKMVEEKGIEEAFLYFAADDAVLNRQNKLIKGKTAIKKYLSSNPLPPNSSLKWKPDFVDISNSGELAYTYGNFVFSSPDTTGQIKESQGVFHTVWKKQEDASWKYVWD